MGLPGWLTKNITYGLFLSDHSVLNDVETEITVLTGIVMQNLTRESAWHLRGLRRIGVAKEDVEVIRECVCFLPPFPSFSLRLQDYVHNVSWGLHFFGATIELTNRHSASLRRGFVVLVCTRCQGWRILSMRCRKMVS